MIDQLANAAAHRAHRHLERHIAAEPGANQREAEGDRADELPLHRSTTTCGCGEERPPTTERVVLEVGDDRSLGIEAGRVERDAAVLTDRDAGEADETLRDHALGGRTLRQRRDRRQLERRQRELPLPPSRRGEEGCRSLWRCHLVAALDSPQITSWATSFHSRWPANEPNHAGRWSTAGRSASLAVMHSAGSRLRAALTGLWGPRVALAGSRPGRRMVHRRRARWSIRGGSHHRHGRRLAALGRRRRRARRFRRRSGSRSCAWSCRWLSVPRCVSWIGGASPTAGACFVACALICGLLVGGADFGQRCVQASAYGDEQRFLLRPPAAFLLPVAIAGLVWAAAVLGAPLLLASSDMDRRCGRCNRRRAARRGCCSHASTRCRVAGWCSFRLASWCTTSVVLGETVMVSRPDIVGDRVGSGRHRGSRPHRPAAGHAVEISVAVDGHGAAGADEGQAHAALPCTCSRSSSLRRRPGMVLRAARRE